MSARPDRPHPETLPQGEPAFGRGDAHASAPARDSLFRPGHNCLGVGRAGRLALLVDGDAYFKAFVHASMRATRSIAIVGWDFHSRTRLHHDVPGVPQQLGDFLNFLVKRRRRLEVRILTWDYPVLFAKGREVSPTYGLGWRPRRRVRFRYDDHYPVGASHHQKLVLIDGALAFCGGLDLTRSRWDTCEHAPADPRRVNDGETEGYAPFHDTMVAMDGEAAGVVESIVRERWLRATGETLAASSADADTWPEELPVTLTDVDVALARTRAPMDGEKPVCEVLQLYLDTIAAAKRSIYIENQYFTSNALGDALAARLAEADGPEVVAVLRLSTDGWLEAPTMGTLRTLILQRLRAADRHGRFHAYYPHIPGLPEGQCCDLHSKLMIVDDELLLVGSANFANRSMGLDTECNAAIEARDDARIAAAICDFRNGLLAEHLDVTTGRLARAVSDAGSLSGGIAALAGPGRSLRGYEHLDEVPETLATVAGVADPEKPVSLEALVAQFAPETPQRSRPLAAWLPALWVLGVMALLAAMWKFTPLAAWTDAQRAIDWARSFSFAPWAPIVVLLLYTPASIVLFPRPVITVFAVAAFGPWHGFAYAFLGILAAAVATYVIGLRLDRKAIRRIARGRLNRLTQIMRRRGVLAMTAVRFLPLAPFAVVNVVAGAMRIRPAHFIAGSALGILPGTLVTTVFGDQLIDALRDPRSIDFWPLAALALAMVASTWLVQRWLFDSSHGSRRGRSA